MNNHNMTQVHKNQSRGAVAVACGRAGSTQKLANKIGVSKRTVIRWKSGAVTIPEERAHAIADTVGVPVSDLRPDLA